MRKAVIFAIMLTMPVLAMPEARAGWTEIKAGPNGHFIVQARIEGLRTPAVIDTGATVVALPYEVARRAGLRPSFLRFDREVWTANGKARAAEVTLRRVEIDNVVARDVRALVMPRGALNHVLIGMSYLGKLRRFAVNAGTLRLVD